MTTLRPTADVAAQLVTETTDNGGATVSATITPPPTTGYVVAVPGHERVLESGHRALIGSPARQRVAAEDYVSERRAILAQPNRYVGAWLDHAGNVVLDVVEIFAEREPAERAGRDRGEVAIYCLDDDETIYVG